MKFRGPSGITFTVGQRILHDSGIQGIVLGLDRKTGKVMIEWQSGYSEEQKEADKKLFESLPEQFKEHLKKIIDKVVNRNTSEHKSE